MAQTCVSKCIIEIVFADSSHCNIVCRHGQTQSQSAPLLYKIMECVNMKMNSIYRMDDIPHDTSKGRNRMNQIKSRECYKSNHNENELDSLEIGLRLY